MSIQNEITRIQTARNTLRTKGVALGIALNTDNLTNLATKYDGISDRGTPSAEVREGESYTIQPGYYHGGTVQGVSGGGNYNLQAKSFTPTKTETTVTQDSGYYGLSSVTVGAIPDAYQDVSDVTATQADVLSPAVFVTSTGAVKAGTMPNRGAVSATLNTETTSYTVPAGYHNGSGTVNIVTEAKSATPSGSAQTITPTVGKVLSAVTVNAIPGKYGDATNKTATAADILATKTAIGWNDDDDVATSLTGTMPNNGAVSVTLTTVSDSYTIPAGYHNGSGEVFIRTQSKQATPSASIQNIKPDSGMVLSGVTVLATPTETKTATPSTATQTITPSANKFLSSVTVNPIPDNYADVTPTSYMDAAYIREGLKYIGRSLDDGSPVLGTGTMPNNGAVSPAALAAGGSYTIPAGYHNGSGVVSAQTLAAQTGVDSGKTAVAAAQMLTGYEGWVNGTKIDGSMPNNGSISGTITGLGAVAGDTSYTIAAGYTTGGTVSITSDIETALSAI